MKGVFFSFPVACLFSVVTLLLSFQSVAGPATAGEKLPERVEYDCSFYVKHYLADAPKLEFGKLSELFVWINRRVAGGLKHNPGRTFASSVESGHWRQTATDDEGKFIRSIWLIPSSVTNKGNPMNVLLERRADSYIVTRVYDEHLQALGFYSYSGEVIDKITHERAFYCEAEEPLTAAAENAE